jgi:hypothetical protein
LSAPPLSELGQAALAWAEQGFAVFPLRSRAKEPLTKHGFHDASTDPAQIASWWRRWPDANIGCATGEPSGRWALDVDGDEGRATLDALVEEHGDLPWTLAVSTGRGWHYWFAGGEDLRNSARQVGPGIDVRATGGYAILPPSVHPDGPVYRALDEAPTMPAPAWLVEIARKPERAAPPPPPPSSSARSGVAGDAWSSAEPGGGAGPRDRVLGMVRAAAGRIVCAVPGTRNETVNRECFSVGGWLDWGGLSIDDVAPALERAAVAAEQNPEVVRRALAEGRAKGRTGPEDRQREPGSRAQHQEPPPPPTLRTATPDRRRPSSQPTIDPASSCALAWTWCCARRSRR